jgi:hypothetical protein
MISYANRAIYYWRLVQPVDVTTPGPLQDRQILFVKSLSLDKSPETAIASFAGLAPKSLASLGKQGALYKLNFGQTLPLQSPLSLSVTGTPTTV